MALRKSATIVLQAVFAMNRLGPRACFSLIYWALGVPEGAEGVGGGRAWSLTEASADPKSHVRVGKLTRPSTA